MAIKIAKQSGAIAECRFHEGSFTDLDDAEAAYRLGNYLFTRGEAGGDFHDRREMTDAIQSAISDADSSVAPARDGERISGERAKRERPVARIISARKATPHERRAYEEGHFQ